MVFLSLGRVGSMHLLRPGPRPAALVGAPRLEMSTVLGIMVHRDALGSYNTHRRHFLTGVEQLERAVA